MTAATFHHLTLREAEGQLIGRCLTDIALLKTCLRELPQDCWRTDQTYSVIFFGLAGMMARGAYDPATNEARMAHALACAEWVRQEWSRGQPVPAYVLMDWRLYLEDLYEPSMASDEVACALLADVIEAYRLQDEEVAAIRANRYKSPFAPTDDAQDAIFLRLKDAVLSERAQRMARPNTPAVPAPVRVDWEGLRRRVAS